LYYLIFTSAHINVFFSSINLVDRGFLFQQVANYNAQIYVDLKRQTILEMTK